MLTKIKILLAQAKLWICNELMKLNYKFKLVIKNYGEKMIGPIEKGFEAAENKKVPLGVYEDIDLSFLPNFICYKTALLKEKLTWKYITVAVLGVNALIIAILSFSVIDLAEKNRLKEYILAPGVMDFTKASPQTVPDSYVDDAVMDFLNQLGNINPTNIEEQYRGLTRFMSDKLKVQFEMDTADWVEQVKTDNISQILTITDKDIISDEKGNYKIVALGKAEFYANHQHLGFEDQVIEMTLSLTPPESGKRWYLKINSLSWSKQETFKTKSNLTK